jgi:enoyl-CoA hydratase/carnithine racemase
MTAAHVQFPAEGVGLLLIDNPPKNFVSYELLAQMWAGIREIEASGASVIVLASDLPGYFLAHAYLPDLVTAHEDPHAVTGDPRLWRKITNQLERGPMVSIACNNGQCWGGGTEISWACNLRTAGRSAHYAQIESILGVLAGAGGSVRLARLAGQSVAMRILLTGEPVSAVDLERWGVVHRIFEDDGLRQGTIDWAAAIASRPARGLQALKRGILHMWDLPFEDALRLEGYMYNSAMSGDAVRDKMRAVQDAYDRGDDSWAAYGLARPPGLEAGS